MFHHQSPGDGVVDLVGTVGHPKRDSLLHRVEANDALEPGSYPRGSSTGPDALTRGEGKDKGRTMVRLRISARLRGFATMSTGCFAMGAGWACIRHDCRTSA